MKLILLMLDTFRWISSYDQCNYLVTSLRASSLGGGGAKVGKMERACTHILGN